jgi:hypothetical protein
VVEEQEAVEVEAVRMVVRVLSLAQKLGAQHLRAKGGIFDYASAVRSCS